MAFVPTDRQKLALGLMANPAYTDVMLYGGSRCLAGETVLDGHTETIAEMASKGLPVMVYTSHGKQMAEAPFLKGTAQLLEFNLECGKAVKVTDDHRFWDGNKWIKARDLSVGASVAVRVPHRPESAEYVANDIPNPSGYGFSKISSISATINQPYYTLHVPGCEQYFANGILHHNSGKTAISCYAIMVRALKYAGSRHAILRYRFNHVKQSVWYDTWPKVMGLAFPTLLPHMQENKSDWFITFPNGSEVWFGGLDDKQRVEKILGNEYCVDLKSKILCADLVWRNAEDIHIGQEIIAFPESLDGHIKLISSFVEGKQIIKAHKYRVLTNRGETIVSADHKFVSLFDDRRNKNFSLLSWKKTTELKKGDLVRFAKKPWRDGWTLSDGWFAGMLDGEGWASAKSKNVGVAQRDNICLQKMFEWLAENEIDYRIHVSKTKEHLEPCYQLITKGIWPSLKMLGITKPYRLNSRQVWENRRAFTAGGYEAKIIDIEYLGIGDVVSFQTSSKTLIHDGFLGHNCTLYNNECSQIGQEAKDMASTRLAQKIDGCRLLALYDCNPPSKKHWAYRQFASEGAPENYASLIMNPVDNLANLPADYLRRLEALPLRQRQRFLHGQFQAEVDGALWRQEWIDKARMGTAPDSVRIAIGVDPAASTGTHGIVVGATDGINFYVLEDASIKGTPMEWGKRVNQMYEKYSADAVVVEVNQGGDMVVANLRQANQLMNIQKVRASKGKLTRAEPISGIYELGRAFHCGEFPELEEEMCTYTGQPQEESPDRMDAMVWAASYLMLKHQEHDIVGSILTTGGSLFNV